MSLLTDDLGMAFLDFNASSGVAYSTPGSTCPLARRMTIESAASEYTSESFGSPLDFLALL